MSAYVGDRGSNIVHVNEPASARCVQINGISPNNVVEFNSLDEAHRQGYHDCECITQTDGPPQ